MKSFFLIFLLCCFSITLAQNLPLVQAQSTQKERFFDWLPLKPKIGDEDNTDGWLLAECSESPNSISVSAYLEAQNRNTYSSEKLTDGDPTTAWIEGKSNAGVGKYIEFKAFPLTNWGILNGYQKDSPTWENYARVKKMRVFIEDKPAFEVMLEDKMGIQTFQLPENVKIDPQKISTGTKIRLVILEIYDGKKSKDVAISEIFFVGC